MSFRMIIFNFEIAWCSIKGRSARHWDLLLLWTPTADEMICHFNLWRTVCCNHSKETFLVKLLYSTLKPRLIRTPHYYRQFALSLEKESPYIFSKFNPLNTVACSRLRDSRIRWIEESANTKIKRGETGKKPWKLLPFSLPVNFSRAFLFRFFSTFWEPGNRLNTDKLF